MPCTSSARTSGSSPTSAGERLAKVRRAELAGAEARMADSGRIDVLGPLVLAGDVRAVWAVLDPDSQRAVDDALMTVTPALAGTGAADVRPGHGGGHAALTGSPVDSNVKCHCSPRLSSLYQSSSGCRKRSAFSLMGRLLPAIAKVTDSWIEAAAFPSS